MYAAAPAAPPRTIIRRVVVPETAGRSARARRHIPQIGYWVVQADCLVQKCMPPLMQQTQPALLQG
jgi:hypothetical protein